jgi:hypothetical protein
MLASPWHTLGDLAKAIDLAFARWDISHLHEFRVGETDYSSYPEGDEPDSNNTLLGDLQLTVGSGFRYVFDLGDGWTHECVIDATDVDPEEVLGAVTAQPVPFFGWGSIPDQYGRETESQDEDDGPVAHKVDS